MSETKILIVGLGNPGRKYRATRHNIGFMAIDQLAESWGIASDRTEQKAIVAKVSRFDCAVILAKPQTFMNNSGDSVGPLANYYQIPPENVLVIYDEIDLPFGTLRIRPKGGAAGHNGMKSIINHLGNDFPRVRLGIGRPEGRMPVHAYVLQPFNKDEQTVVEIMLRETADAVETFLRDGVELMMSRHNRKEIGGKGKGE
ncbi:MAG TPA: aminoacyl-tRNA hydrolase [Anaerolineae bacterium]|nr:aminoacyl-tRNA hydrolase [Anaerolineae bacterium]